MTNVVAHMTEVGSSGLCDDSTDGQIGFLLQLQAVVPCTCICRYMYIYVTCYEKRDQLGQMVVRNKIYFYHGRVQYTIYKINLVMILVPVYNHKHRVVVYSTPLPKPPPSPFLTPFLPPPPPCSYRYFNLNSKFVVLVFYPLLNTYTKKCTISIIKDLLTF